MKMFADLKKAEQAAINNYLSCKAAADEENARLEKARQAVIDLFGIEEIGISATTKLVINSAQRQDVKWSKVCEVVFGKLDALLARTKWAAEWLSIKAAAVAENTGPVRTVWSITRKEGK